MEPGYRRARSGKLPDSARTAVSKGREGATVSIGRVSIELSVEVLLTERLTPEHSGPRYVYRRPSYMSWASFPLGDPLSWQGCPGSSSFSA